MLFARVKTLIIIVLLATTIVGCGFHLQGNNPSAAPLVYQRLHLEFPKDTEALEERLSVYLAARGVNLSNANDAYTLRIVDYTPRRQLLNGKLTEVLLRLTITFQIEDQEGNLVVSPRTLTATRSYQYDLVTVNTENQEEVFLNQIVVDDIAQQLARQISSNRLPQVNASSPSP